MSFCLFVFFNPSNLVSVGFIEDGPAEDGHVEDDDEAVKYRERCHLQVLISEGENEYEKEDKDEDGDQSQEGGLEVEGGPADDVEGDEVS